MGYRREAGARSFRQTTSGAHGSAGRADCLPRGKPPACSDRRQLCRKQIPPAREKGLQPYGARYCFGWRSEGGAGGRAESPLLTPQRENSAEEISLMGPDAPTPAREEGLQPYGALTLFFRWRKKSVQKKASGTATPGKRLLLPILTAGLAMSRAMELARLRLLSCALGARLFPPSKWAGLFPSAAYRRSAPPQLAAGRRTPCGLGCFVVARLLCRTKMKTFVSHTVGDERASPLWGNGLLLLGRFRKVSGQRVWGREP